MANILLIHGSWHGGWVWSDIAAALKDLGHEPLTPCLRGLGEDADNLSPDIGLWTHVNDLEQLVIAEDLENLVLVGHSYGGTVVHGLEGRIAHRLHAVIHLEGAIPAPGTAIMDSWHDDYRQEILTLAVAHDGWLVPPPDPGVWTGLTRDQQQRLRSMLRPQSLRTYQDIMPANLDMFDGPHLYLWATDRPTRPYRHVVERYQAHPNWVIIETTGGHELPLTNMAAVMRLIVAALAGETLPVSLNSDGTE